MDESQERVIAEWAQRVARLDADELERKLRLLIQPKPWWVPQWIWEWLIRHIVVLEIRF